MPVPALLVRRENELGRSVVPEDFTMQERNGILGIMPQCIQDTYQTMADLVAMGQIRQAKKVAQFIGALEDTHEAFTNAVNDDEAACA